MNPRHEKSVSTFLDRNLRFGSHLQPREALRVVGCQFTSGQNHRSIRKNFSPHDYGERRALRLMVLALADGSDSDNGEFLA